MGTSLEGWPDKVEVLPKPIEAVIRILGRLTAHCALDVHNSASTHFRPPQPSERGAEAMLSGQIALFDYDKTGDPYINAGSYTFKRDLE